MLVLSIIAGLIVLVLVAIGMQYLNEYTKKHYRYEMFNLTTFVLYAIGYVLLYGGYRWIEDALQHKGDWLNGAVLIVIGVVLLIIAVVTIIKHTSLRYGVMLSIVLGVLYAAVTPITIYMLILAVAMLFETRPVYNLNSK